MKHSVFWRGKSLDVQEPALDWTELDLDGFFICMIPIWGKANLDTGIQIPNTFFFSVS